MASTGARTIAELSDGELAHRATAHDREAEAELCRRFAPRIRLYGLKHLRDEDRARELVQLVLIAVLEAVRAGRVDEPEHLDRFVLGVSRNLTSRMRRTEARLQPTAPEELDLESVMPRMEALDLGALVDCMGALEVRARTVLFLSFFRDRSTDEIAGALATTPGNIRVVRHRAMAQLRDCLGEAQP